MIDTQQIKDVILDALEGAHVEVRNPREDGLHFDALVVASQFEGKNLVEQHQMVMGSLKELFGSSVLHAMSLKTYTPIEWKEVEK